MSNALDYGEPPVTIYTAGYTGLSIFNFERVVSDGDYVIVDVRYAPRSRNPDWSRKRLNERFSGRYFHVKDLGNVDYKSANIRIADIVAGTQFVKTLLDDYKRPILLLCMCKTYHDCHRKVVAEHLAGALGMQVEHLTPDAFLPADAQPTSQAEQLSLL